ncbi:PaeR7I family type II restriction endonuclease [Actinocorallia lasiicapitis]
MIEHPAQLAIETFWKLRSAVTSNQHMRELERLVENEFLKAGIPASSIRHGSAAELPGYYRATKKWDTVVVHNGILVAAIEFKSQVGPSFGNNANNRTEEALGSAADIWEAYNQGIYGKVRPWLGYVFLLEEAPVTLQTVRVHEKKLPFPLHPAFRGSSRKDRYRILCERLVTEGIYDAAWYLTTSAGSPAKLTEPDLGLNFARFSQAIAERVASIHRHPHN